MVNFPCRVCIPFMRVSALPRHRLVLRWLAGALWLAAAAAQAAPFAYVADRVQKTVSVVDMASYATTAVIAMESAASSPVDVVASEATGTVWLAQGSGISFIDAASHRVTGSLVLPGIKALVVAPDGQKAYALTNGSVAVIDAATRTVKATLAVDPSAAALAIDKDGETVYAAHTGLAPGGAVLGAAGITVIDGLIDDVDRVIDTGGFRPEHLAVNPGDDRLYMTGRAGSLPDKQAYTVLDPATHAITRVAFAVPPETPLIFVLGSMAFNAGGSRLYVSGTTFGTQTIPVLEIDTASGAVARVLSLPNVLGDGHTVLKIATSLAGGKFVLAAFLSETAHHYPVEPRRRVVFVDVASGAVLSQFTVPNFGDGDFLIGDILDDVTPPAAGQRQPTTTALQASVPAPLSRNLPVTFSATVSSSQPGGKVVFKFVSQDGRKRVEKVPVALAGGMATLALPACNERMWSSWPLRKIVCGDAFKVVAVFKGDALNARSKSEPLHESR